MDLPKPDTGKIHHPQKVSVFVGKRMETYSDHRVLLDGEHPGQLPVIIDIVPGVALLIAPK